MTLRFIAAVLALALAACAEPPLRREGAERVVLLPGSDGSIGALVVQQGGREVTLDSPYATTAASPDGALAVSHADAAQVRADFAHVLAALPPAPVSYT